MLQFCLAFPGLEGNVPGTLDNISERFSVAFIANFVYKTTEASPEGVIKTSPCLYIFFLPFV